MKNTIYSFSLLIFLFIVACDEQKVSKWQEVEKVELAEKIAPIGLVFQNDRLWLADGDNNRLVEVNENSGEIIQSLGNFERPMHIASFNNKLFIPEYGNDKITILENTSRDSLEVGLALDAPAGIHISESGDIAIADFYNHQILLKKNDKWISVGKKGKADGEFHYPTDVQIINNKLFVADAYNNQVQVFDLKGNHLQTIGKETGLNAATGIYVDDHSLYVTDFENDRVLIFDLEGKLKQIISENLDKPTDLIIHKNQLYVINYKGKFINKYKLQ